MVDRGWGPARLRGAQPKCARAHEDHASFDPPCFSGLELSCAPRATPTPAPLQIDLDFDGDDESRVLLLVHDTKPPFLEGKVGGGGRQQCARQVRCSCQPFPLETDLSKRQVWTVAHKMDGNVCDDPESRIMSTRKQVYC